VAPNNTEWAVVDQLLIQAVKVQTSLRSQLTSEYDHSDLKLWNVKGKKTLKMNLGESKGKPPSGRGFRLIRGRSRFLTSFEMKWTWVYRYMWNRTQDSGPLSMETCQTPSVRIPSSLRRPSGLRATGMTVLQIAHASISLFGVYICANRGPHCHGTKYNKIIVLVFLQFYLSLLVY